MKIKSAIEDKEKLIEFIKKEYFKFEEYINTILPNDNKESFENNIAALLKLIDMNYKLKDL